MNEEILNAVMKMFIDFLLPVILGGVVWLIKESIPLIRAHVEQKKLAFAISLVGQLVSAAEQSGLAGIIKNEAKVKHDWVIAQLEASLQKRKINIDLDEYAAIIEAQVWDKLNSYKDDFWLDLLDPDPELEEGV